MVLTGRAKRRAKVRARVRIVRARPLLPGAPAADPEVNDEPPRRFLQSSDTIRLLLESATPTPAAALDTVRKWDALVVPRLTYALPPDHALDLDPTLFAWAPPNIGGGNPPGFPGASDWPPVYRPTAEALRRYLAEPDPDLRRCATEQFAAGTCTPDPNAVPPATGHLSAEALFDFAFGGHPDLPAPSRVAPVRQAFLARVTDRELDAIGAEVRDQALLLRERLPSTAPFSWADCVPGARRSAGSGLDVPESFAAAIPPVRAAFVALCHCHNTDAIGLHADTGAVSNWPAEPTDDGHGRRRPAVLFLDFTGSPRWDALDRAPFLAVWPLRVVTAGVKRAPAGPMWAERTAAALWRTKTADGAPCTTKALQRLSRRPRLSDAVGGAVCAWRKTCQDPKSGLRRPGCPSAAAWVEGQEGGKLTERQRQLLSKPIIRLLALDEQTMPLARAFLHAAAAVAFGNDYAPCPFVHEAGIEAWRGVLACTTETGLEEVVDGLDPETERALRPVIRARAAAVATASSPTWLHAELDKAGVFNAVQLGVLVDLAMQVRDADTDASQVTDPPFDECAAIVSVVCSPELSAIENYRNRRAAAVERLRSARLTKAPSPFVLPGRPDGKGAGTVLYALASGGLSATRPLDFDASVAYRDLAGRIALALVPFLHAASVLTNDAVVAFAAAGGFVGVDGSRTRDVVAGVELAAACIADDRPDHLSRPQDVCRFCLEYDRAPWTPFGKEPACCAECRDSRGARHSAGLCWVASKGGHPRMAVASFTPSPALAALVEQEDEVESVVTTTAALLTEAAHADALRALMRTGKARIRAMATGGQSPAAIGRRLVLVREAISSLVIPSAA